MNFLLFAVRKQRFAVVLAALVGIIAGGANAGIIALVHHIIRTELQSTGLLIFIFISLVSINFLFNLLSVYLLNSIAQKKLCNLRIQISQQILNMPYEQVEKTGRSNLIASLTSDLDKICMAIEQLPTLLINGATIGGCLIYMGYLSIEVFLLNIAFLGIGLFFYQYPLNYIEKDLVVIREGWDKLVYYFDSLVNGLKELLLHKQRRDRFLRDCLNKSSEKLRDDIIKVRFIQKLVYSWGDLLYSIGLGFILFIVTPLLDLDKDTLTGYILAGLFVIPPMTSILQFGPRFGDFRVAVQKMEQMGFNLYEMEEDPIEKESLPRNLKVKQENSFEFKNISYHYHNGNDDIGFKIGPVNLSFKPGELCFLTGGNGSGKTTLLKLLCGLYTPDSGEIYWNQQSLFPEEQRAYRENFSVVFSDFFLFDRLFGIIGNDTDNRAQKLLVQLNLDHKVAIKNGCFSTLELSQGQRKRLALLVACLEDRPFYLFDEWAATQDFEFKNIFYHQILPELISKGKTVIAITHDEQFFHLAQRRIKIHEGKIVEDKYL